MLRLSALRMLGCVSCCAAIAASGCLLPPTRMSAAPGASADSGGDGAPHNLLGNGTFDGGVSLPWTSSFTLPGAGDSSVVDGELCLDVSNVGKNRWDVQLRHREMVIQRGHTYSHQLPCLGRHSRPARDPRSAWPVRPTRSTGPTRSI